jgi:hypothetical protein
MRAAVPSKYYLTVTNSCGVPLSDTVLIQQAPFLNFYVGPDTALCLNDPVTLQAPGGYSQYVWKMNNNATTLNGQSISVVPPLSTLYFATAKTSLGCWRKTRFQ